jgi:hypothetical protein
MFLHIRERTFPLTKKNIQLQNGLGLDISLIFVDKLVLYSLNILENWKKKILMKVSAHSIALTSNYILFQLVVSVLINSF